MIFPNRCSARRQYKSLLLFATFPPIRGEQGHTAGKNRATLCLLVALSVSLSRQEVLAGAGVWLGRADGVMLEEDQNIFINNLVFITS